MKERLDVILTSLGLAESREKAKAIIMSGNVYVDGQREDKAGAMFDREKQVIEVKGNTLKYVSRGGLKLEKAVPGGEDLYGHRGFHRRFYGLYAAERRGEGVCRGCGARTAGMEAAE